MITLEDLKPNKGAVKKVVRVGRGRSSGCGKTSSRGHNGEGQRSGRTAKRGFEGGQMPIARRVPKRGFNHNAKKVYVIVNLADLANLPEGTVVDYGFVMENGLAKAVKNNCGLKVLGNGELNVALTVKAAKFSASAKEAIEAAKGTAETL